MAKGRNIDLLCRVADGEIVPSSWYNWSTALKVFEGKEVVVSIGPKKKLRSIPQNSYLFGGPYKMISEATGQDIESIHEFFKSLFLKTYDRGPIPTTRSTASLSTVEFIEYYRKIIQWAAEFLGLYIPEPNEEEMWGSLVETYERSEKCRS
jgi:hypothetical protein